ncbi:MAG: ImmA/IrrE family metallo-endopeptidase [Chloroflexi bacterium]|nr:ImmA/IrrE family metallo-endopeptidase [Chloroflexota bacterium]
MIAERIRQARLAAGFTQEQLADALHMTKQVISKYENGRSEPTASIIMKLAQALDRNPAYFLREPQIQVSWLGYRSRSSLGQRAREGIQYRAEAYAEQYVTLAEALAVEHIEALPPRQPIHDVEAADDLAMSVRVAWSLGEQPLDDVTTLIESKGGVVFGEQNAPDVRFDGLSGWIDAIRPVIVLNLAMPVDRRRFSLAHELAHLLMDDSTNHHESVEAFANRFAGAFLVPASAARRELGDRRRHVDLEELALLKQIYGLSIAGWVYRAADLDIISRAMSQRLWAEMSRRGWRKGEPPLFKAEETPTRLRQMVLRAHAEGIISRAQANDLCPGCLPPPADQPLSPRDLMRLPPEERQRLLAEATATYDEDDVELLEAFGEDDIVE